MVTLPSASWLPKVPRLAPSSSRDCPKGLSIELTTPPHAPDGRPMTEAEALALARSVAEQEGWPFLEPTSTVFRRRWFGRGGAWTIHAHTNAMKGQGGITIHDENPPPLGERLVQLPR